MNDVRVDSGARSTYAETVASDGVSIVIPACNEEHGIGVVLDRVREAMAAGDPAFEIIVVDDGSEDATARRAAAAGETVRVHRHQGNRGYGAALKTGIRHAAFKTICITDADGTYPAEVIPKLLGWFEEGNFDMVVGARTGQNVALPIERRPAKWLLGKLANYVVGEPIPDLNSGLRVFRREDALRLFDVLPDGFSFTTTITVAMLTNGYLVRYEPIDYHRRVGRSKIRPVRDTLNFLQLIVKMALYFAPLKVFMPLSAILMGLAVGWAASTLFIFGEVADVSTLVIAMAAIQVGAIGMLAELVRSRVRSPYRGG